MSPERAALAALVLVGTCLASPASAQVGPRTVTVYPLSAGGAGAADVRDVELLLDAALQRAVQRNGDIVLAQPLVTRGACGAAATATAQCLAGLAGGGLVLRVAVHRSQSTLVVMLEAVDARARMVGPVTVSVDAYAQSSGPLTHGVLMLVEQATASSRPRADLRPAEPVPLPAPVALERKAPPRQPRAWMRTAGPWLTGAGLALLGGGVAVSVMNRSLSDELDRKHAAGTLAESDLASYRRVDQYNQLTQALLASGGALTIAGAAIWTAAPERGRLVAGVAGSF